MLHINTTMCFRSSGNNLITADIIFIMELEHNEDYTVNNIL